MTKRCKIIKNGRQVIILTGGIATGKSYLISLFEKYGFHVFNSDAFIYDLMQPAGAAYKDVAALVPSCVTDGIIDRGLLSSIVFNDKNLLLKLEDIIYPLLREHRSLWINDIRSISDSSVVIEIPLFFEKNVEINHDVVISTICPLEIQRSRAIARGRMDLQTIDSIISQQVSNEHRIRNSDIIIYTDCSYEETKSQLLACLSL